MFFTHRTLNEPPGLILTAAETRRQRAAALARNARARGPAIRLSRRGDERPTL